MKKQPMTIEDIRRFAENVAQRNNWALNPDEGFLGDILEGLRSNRETLGYLQCPCRVSWDDVRKDRDIVCPCRYAAEDIAEFGHCYCALFFDPRFIQEGREAGSIPERRPEEYYP